MFTIVMDAIVLDLPCLTYVLATHADGEAIRDEVKHGTQQAKTGAKGGQGTARGWLQGVHEDHD